MCQAVEAWPMDWIRTREITFSSLTASGVRLCRSRKIQRQVRFFPKGFHHSRLAEIVADEVTLFQVVQALGEYINDDDPATRGKATGYFSEVISRLAPNSLSAKHAQVVCTFLCSRMEDRDAITGIMALQQQRVFSSEMAVMTLRA